jgi:hypothetical protein
MPYLSSLPALVEIEDWLDEDLPAVVGRLAATVPDRVVMLGLPGGYPSVAGGDGLGDSGGGRVLALVTLDDEISLELISAEEMSGTIPLISYLTEQSESMNVPVRGF